MKICQGHWDVLVEEVKAQGMGEWIAPDAETAVLQLVDQVTNSEDTPTNFEPLMRCYMMIANRAMQIAGLGVLRPEFGCPICNFNSMRSDDGVCLCNEPDCQGKEPGSIPDFTDWLRGPESCVASVREHMVEKGWI